MTTFKDVFGPKLGHTMEQYAPYTFLIFSVYLILYQIGIWKIIYKLIKQAVIMAVMLLCCTIWYVLMTQHVSALTSIGTTAILSAINDAISGNASQLISNTKIMEPLTEILVISGATLFLLGLLYRQLPIDLIPDCIPCIGHYDNMMAGFCVFCGFIICIFGVYCQLNYSNSPNSSTSIVQLINKSKEYIDLTEKFIQNEDVNKWDNLSNSAQYFVQRGTEITSHSFQFIYTQIVQQMESYNDSTIKHNEL